MKLLKSYKSLFSMQLRIGIENLGWCFSGRRNSTRSKYNPSIRFNGKQEKARREAKRAA